MSGLYVQDTPVTIKDAKGLHLITMSTGSGHKAQIMGEELKELYGLEFTTTLINLITGDQKKEWYRHLSPNCMMRLSGPGSSLPLAKAMSIARIPLLIDNTQSPPFPVMETGAIILYLLDLADKDNILGFEDKLEQSQAMQWLFFSHNASAIQSQLVFWHRFTPEKNPPTLAKYRTDFLRLLELLEEHFSGKYTGQPRDYLAGKGRGKYSFADIATWPQLNYLGFSGFTDDDTKPFPYLMKYTSRISQRPAVKRGIGEAYNPK